MKFICKNWLVFLTALFTVAGLWFQMQVVAFADNPLFLLKGIHIGLVALFFVLFLSGIWFVQNRKTLIFIAFLLFLQVVPIHILTIADYLH